MNEYVAGSTSVVDLIFLQDSTSTTGAGKTGLVYNTASLTCYYKRSNGTASVAVTLATITTLGTFNSGGLKEVDATNMPGCYEFHPPDAAFASGAKEVTFFFTGATGLVPRPIKYRILVVNLDATGGKVPATLAASDVTGNVAADVQTIKTQTVTCSGGVTIPAATLASTTNITAGTIATVTTLTNLPAITAGWLTATGIAASALNGKGDWSTYAGGDTSGTTTLLSRIGGSITIAGGKVAATLAATDVTGNVAADIQTIKTQAVTCAGGVTIPAATLASTTNITAGTISTVTTLTNLPAITAGWLTATGIAAAALNGKGDWLLSSGYTAPPSAATIATAVRDVNNTAPAGSSLGAAVNSAASAGDPWSTALPGAYGAGTAGNILGGTLAANVTRWNGTAVTTPTIAGVPIVDVGYVGGTAATASSGALDANLVSVNGTTFAGANAPVSTSAIATAVRDVNNTAPAGSSLGAAVNGAASAGDPWATAIPGAYGAGTAGNILGNTLAVNVTKWRGAAVATNPMSGVPIVDVGYVGGATATASSGALDANLVSINGTVFAGANAPADLQTIKTQAVTCSGGVTIPAATLASTTNITAGTISTVTTLTNLPAITAGWLTATGIAASALNGKGDWLLSSGYTAPPSSATIATAVRDVNNTAPAGSSLGAAVNSAASAGDPWSTALPGAYGAGTAGKIIGDIKTTIGVAGAGLTSIPYTGPSTVTLAASQPSYAPARAGDAMTLTAPYDAAKTAAQAGTAMTLTSGERNTLVDLVWDEPKAGHAAANTYGAYLDAAVSGVSTGGVSAVDIATAVWASTTRTLTAFGFTVTANVTQWRGSNVATNPMSGVPVVDVGYVGGATATASSGALDANLVSINGTVFAGANAPTNLQLIRGQTVTAPSGVTFPAAPIGTSVFAGGAVASVTSPVVAGTVSDKTGYRLDLTQPIADVQTTTVGGALNGAWAAAWGKVMIDLIAKLLEVWGAGNATGTPSRTFDLDSSTTPTSRIPR